MNGYTYSFIRQVDEHGRIVLPKDFRDSLNIDLLDAVDITLSGKLIQIKKYEQLQTLSSLCDEALNALSKSSNIPCVVCDTTQVITSRNASLLSGVLISEDVKHFIRTFTPYLYDESTYCLTDSDRYPIDSIFLIGSKDNPIGAIVLLRYRPVTDVERGNAKFLADFLSGKLNKKEKGW